MELRHVFLVISVVAMGTFVIPSVYSTFNGQHSFIDTGSKTCPSCHFDIQIELDSSMSHSTMTCETCHVSPNLQNSVSHGNIIVPKCMDCHANIIPFDKDSHKPFIQGANSSLKNGDDEACILCHSNTNKVMTFSRPSFVEWDVRNNNGSWLIENLRLGSIKNIGTSTNSENGGIHSISIDNGCINCHNDIRNAVIQGGHSNEKWQMKHDYSAYPDMNAYCRSCHKSSTGNIVGTVPYPAIPFNSPVHASMTLSCLDCHIKADLIANVNGGMRMAPFNSGIMGNIDIAMSKQPLAVQSYLCIACKNTGNPSPVNGTLHFKINTEPDTTIDLSIIPIPLTNSSNTTSNATPNITITPNATPNVTITPNVTETPNITETPVPNVTVTPNVTETPVPNVTVTPNVTEVPTPNVTEVSTPNGTQNGTNVTELISNVISTLISIPNTIGTIISNVTTPILTSISSNSTETPVPTVTETPVPTVTETLVPTVIETPVINVTINATNISINATNISINATNISINTIPINVT